jgi:hypothetical protein
VKEARKLMNMETVEGWECPKTDCGDRCTTLYTLKRAIVHSRNYISIMLIKKIGMIPGMVVQACNFGTPGG